MSTNNLIPSTSAGGFSTVGNVVSGNISATANITAAIFTTTGDSGNITGANVVSANTFSMLHNSTITEVASPVPGNYAIALSATGASNVNQQLLVYPTSIDANHLHLTTGNLYSSELFLGNDDLYVKLANTGNVVVNANDNVGNTAQWIFGANGNLAIPGNIVVSDTPVINIRNENGNPGGPGVATLTAATSVNPGETTIQVGWTVTGNNLVGTTTVTAINDLGSGVLEFVTDTAVTDPFWYNDVYTFTGTSTGLNVWNYGYNGALTLPGEGVIYSNNDTINLKSLDTANGIAYGARIGTSGGLYLEQGSNPAYLTFDSSAGNAQIYSASGLGGNAGHNLTIYAGSADEVTYSTSPGGNIYLQAGAGASNDGGGGGQGGSINLTTGNSLDPAGVAGNVTINSSTSTWTFDNMGALLLPSGGTLTTGNLTIGAANGLGTISTIIENNGELYVYATANGTLSTGWANSYPSTGDVATLSFNQVSNEGNAVIQTGNTAGITYEWVFDNAGNLTVPLNIIATTSSPAPLLQNFEFKTYNGNIGSLNNSFIVNATTALAGNGLGYNLQLSSGNSVNSTAGNVNIIAGVGNVNGSINFNVLGNSYGSLGTGVAFGYLAGSSGFQTSGIAIGTQAGQTDQGYHAIAIGWRVGENSQGNGAIAIGENAGFATQSEYAIAIGTVAGRQGQASNAVAIGASAGYASQGAAAVAVGYQAGLSSQGTNSVAIGVYAANISQGSSSVAVGGEAGQSAQGVNSVAVGVAAGAKGQGTAATALGWTAGQYTQGSYAVALGSGAAYTNQGNGAIAIGADTSAINQGTYSIAIGSGAGFGNIQANNSIILDATGTGATAASNAGLYITPVRNDTGNTTNVVYYNTTTKELTYGPASGGSYGNSDVAAYLSSGTVSTDYLTTAVICAQGNVRGGNINTAGLVTATGNVQGGNILTGGIISATGNINSAGNLSLTGSIIANNITGYGNIIFNQTLSTQGGSDLSLIPGTGLTRNYGNFRPYFANSYDLGGSTTRWNNVYANVTNSITESVTGNITGGNVLTSGLVSATGNLTSGNVTTGIVSATGNVYASNFIGNISIVGNVQGTSSNVALVAGSNTWTFDNTGNLTLSSGSVFNKASGLVNAGTYVTLDNIKATLTASGNRGLSLATVSGSFSAFVGGTFAITSSTAAGGAAGALSVTTSPSTSVLGWNFTGAGDISTYILTDTTNSLGYRITLQIGSTYLNNLIVIERLA